jgi:hypothetical protein
MIRDNAIDNMIFNKIRMNKVKKRMNDDIQC